jgi:hypothetical protein
MYHVWIATFRKNANCESFYYVCNIHYHTPGTSKYIFMFNMFGAASVISHVSESNLQTEMSTEKFTNMSFMYFLEMHI